MYMFSLKNLLINTLISEQYVVVRMIAQSGTRPSGDPPLQSSEIRLNGSERAREAAMEDGSCHGVHRTKAGPGHP